MAHGIEDRDNKILNAAIECARTDGYQWITRRQIAKQAGVSTGLVSGAFGSMLDVKRAVLKAAVERGIVELVAQGLADRHPIALAAPAALKEAAAIQLATA